MKIAGSFLKIINNNDKVKELDKVSDYLHFDIMDGIFTESPTPPLKDLDDVLKGTTKPRDIHLMVVDVKKYVDNVLKFEPKNITFHIELDDTKELIEYIKNKKVKVGLAINPETDIEKVYPYLKDIDIVLLMSVPPGKGGQKFIDITDKIKKLVKYRKENELDFEIEVDGGINDKTINKVKDIDIAVCGSYITDSDDYENQILKLKKNAFTLAELLAVIIILSIISLIAITTVDTNIKKGRVKSCLAQEKNIIEGVKMYMIDNPSKTGTVTIKNLTDGGYIEEGLINPMTDKAYKNGTKINVTSYAFTYASGDKGCE